MTDSPESRNLTWHHGNISRQDREKLHGHRAATLWFTGLSGSGKSTVARRVEEILAHQYQARVYCLDGDNVRHGLSGDLGFSEADRHENIRRIGELCKLFTDAGTLTLASFVSPYRADRERIRSAMDEGDFLEIHVAADVGVCASRDPKGLYKRAQAGEIENFTGVSAPYEAPQDPELVLRTDQEDVDASAQHVIDLLVKRGYIADAR